MTGGGASGRPASHDIDGTHNFRDVGGMQTADGRLVRPGLLYRSASLDSLTEAGRATLAGLGIRTIIDIRSEGEVGRNGRYAHEGSGVDWFHVASPVGPPTGGGDPAREAAMARVMASEDPMALILPMLLGRAGPMFAGALEIIAEPERAPLVFHCTSGKDRTGLLGVVIHLILGVELETALVEFERSAEAYEHIRADIGTRYPFVETMPAATLDRMAAADRAWVVAALDTIGGVAGVEPWLDSIGIGADVRSTLRRLYLES
ncbi:MAG: tyrosine-protein phosphatase [Acidimicrobiales bacterium]